MRAGTRKWLLGWLLLIFGAAVAGFQPAMAADVFFSGIAAPPASADVGGLSLVATHDGPQVALMPHAGRYVLHLPPGQSVDIRVPLPEAAGARTLTVEALLVEGGLATVGLELENEGDSGEFGKNAGQVLDVLDRPVRLAVAVTATGTVRLTATAGSAPAAVRWQGLALQDEDSTVAVPIQVAAHDPGDGPSAVLPDPAPAIEREMIEWDWRLQDGIGTERLPRSYAAAARTALERGDALLADFRRRGVPVEAETRRWQQLQELCEQQPDSEAEDSPAWQTLWRQIRWLRREIAFANPLVQDRPLVFVKQVPSIFSHQLTQYYGACARPGGGIFLLSEPGRSFRCQDLTPPLPLGSYQHLDVSPDGDRLLFAYCHAETTPRARTQFPDRHYHLYEMAADGSQLRALTSGPYDDIAPRYLPDGNIMFISTRRGGFHRCGQGPCPTYALALVGVDGSNPRPVSYHETHEWDPAVLNDGRVIYTRWDYVDRHAVHYQQLWTVRPDGADVRIFYGNNTLNPVGVWEARAVPGSNRVMATAAAHHAMTAGSIILLDVTRGVDGLEPIRRLTPDALFPESEAPVIRESGGMWHAPDGLDARPEFPAEQQRWPGHCYRTPCPLSEDYFYAAYSYASLIGEPTGNPANMFGLYLVDRFGNRELVYRDWNISSLWPSLLESRPWGTQIAATASEGSDGEGTFLVQNLYESWRSLPPERITRLRIVQVLPKSTPHINAPRVGLANASPGRQVLGTVPVEADGSAWFRAPAGIPLAFQALDDRGQAVQIMRSLTYLQDGEQVSCIGCHESRNLAPAASSGPPLALMRPPSSLEPGPPGSRPLSYPQLVQPILDQHCVRCHQPEQADGDVVLTGEPEGAFTVSYNRLVRYVPISEWPKSGFPHTNSEPATRPDFFGSRASPLMRLLLEGHHDVQLDAAEFERLATWMDVNALFYGTFDPSDQARQLRGESIAGPAVE